MSVMTSESVQTFLGFELGSNLPGSNISENSLHGMISTVYLAEVLKLTVEDMIPIPSRSSAIIGVHNWRGEVLWLVDVGCVLGLPPIVQRHHPFTQYSVIIAKYNTGSLGLVVERVEHMLRLDPSEIKQIGNSNLGIIDLRSIDCINGYWQSPQQDNFLDINFEALIRQLRS